VVLVSTRNPLNMGAVARAMSNFGVFHLRVVDPYEVAFRRAKSAVGASELLANAEEFSSVADAVADCALVVGTTAVGPREVQHPVRSLEDGARVIRRKLAPAKVALLFGSEKYGLSNNDMSHCHWLMRIPTRAEHRSMNLGQAAAICLYELVRKGRPGGPIERKPVANAAEVERITTVLFDVLRFTRYWNPGSSKSTEEKVRRLIRRLHLEKGDAEVLLGMLRQVLWKVNVDSKK